MIEEEAPTHAERRRFFFPANGASSTHHTPPSPTGPPPDSHDSPTSTPTKDEHSVPRPPLVIRTPSTPHSPHTPLSATGPPPVPTPTAAVRPSARRTPSLSFPTFKQADPFIVSSPIPPPIPPPLSNWLSSTLGEGSITPSSLSSLTAASLRHSLASAQVQRSPTLEMHRLADGLYDVYTAHDQRRQVGEVRDGVFEGPTILFLSNRGLPREALAHPADYTQRLARIPAQEQLKPGEPSAVVADVRPRFADNKRCVHVGCDRGFTVRGRHHCRSCGRAACKDHAQFRMPLPQLYFPLDVPQKVCDGCFRQQQNLAQLLRGDVYIGPVHAKVMQGWGVLIAAVDGLVYQGDFKAGERTGLAQINYTKPHRRIYRGEVRAGLPHGRGRLLYLDKDDADLAGHQWDSALADHVPEWGGELVAPAGGGRGVAVYVGEWRAGQREGEAVMFSQGWRYQGRWQGHAMTDPTPASILAWWNGDVYRGPIVQWQRHGRGDFQSPSQFLTYVGDWERDVMTGQGEMHWGDEALYKGAVKEGKPDGSGVMKYAGGARYEGEWVMGVRQGNGDLTLSPSPPCYSLSRTSLPAFPSPYPSPPSPTPDSPESISRYQGEWLSDVPHGRGFLYYRNGARYVGSLVDGEVEDVAGKVWYGNGDHYQGGVVGGCREGQGVYSYKATGGNAWKGMWKAGRRVGMEAAMVTHAGRGDVYQGHTSYRRGDWFNSATPLSAAPAAADADRQFAYPCLPDLPWLSRHGPGTLSLPVCDGVRQVQSEWVQDVAEGAGTWTFSDGTQLQATLVKRWNERSLEDARLGLTSTLTGPATLLFPSTKGQIRVAAFRTCLLLLDVAILSSTIRPALSCEQLLSTYLDAAPAQRSLREQLRSTLTPPSPANLSRSTPSSTPPQFSSPPKVATCRMASTALSPSFAFLPFGYCEWSDGAGTEWTGLMLAGRAEGWGRRRWTLRGQRGEHVGEWRWGVKHGLGRCLSADGSHYIGQYQQGRRKGRGRWRLQAEDQPPAPALSFEGEFDGAPSGRGRLVGESGTSHFDYTGDVHEGRIAGVGRLRLHSAVEYVGQWMDGYPHGCGRLSNAVASYTGEFLQGQCTGRGRLYVDAPFSGSRRVGKAGGEWARSAKDSQSRVELLYEGTMEGGVFEGRGRLSLRLTEGRGCRLLRYDGQFHRRLFHGLGSLRLYRLPHLRGANLSDELQAGLRDDDCIHSYSGSWGYGLQHGMGYDTRLSDEVGASPTVSTFIGTFVQGVQRGYGRLTMQHAEGIRASPPHLRFVEYSGAVDDGLRSGFGSSLLPHGDRHTGSYQRGLMHGFGDLAFASGDAFAGGRWREDRLWGTGTLTFNRAAAPLKGTEPHAAASTLRALHEVDGVDCGFIDDALQGVCTFKFSPKRGDGLRAVAVVLDKGHLSSAHAVRMESSLVGTYTGGVHFRGGEDVDDSPGAEPVPTVERILRAAATLDQELRDARGVDGPSLSNVQQAIDRLLALLPSLPFSPFHSNAAALRSLCAYTGPFFPLHLLALFLSHSSLLYHGQGQLIHGDTDAYTGGWAMGQRSGDTVWSRRETLSWLIAPDAHPSAKPTEEVTVYTGRVEGAERHGVGSLLVKGRQLKVTARWERGEPLLDHVRVDDYAKRCWYVGSVERGLVYEGFGTLVYPSLDPYHRHVGEFHRGQAQGKGSRKGAQGLYVGQFHKGKQHGEGRWEGRDGAKVVGVWEADRCIKMEPWKLTAPPPPPAEWVARKPRPQSSSPNGSPIQHQ